MNKKTKVQSIHMSFPKYSAEDINPGFNFSQMYLGHITDEKDRILFRDYFQQLDQSLQERNEIPIFGKSKRLNQRQRESKVFTYQFHVLYRLTQPCSFWSFFCSLRRQHEPIICYLITTVKWAYKKHTFVNRMLQRIMKLFSHEVEKSERLCLYIMNEIHQGEYPKFVCQRGWTMVTLNMLMEYKLFEVARILITGHENILLTMANYNISQCYDRWERIMTETLWHTILNQGFKRSRWCELKPILDYGKTHGYRADLQSYFHQAICYNNQDVYKSMHEQENFRPTDANLMKHIVVWDVNTLNFLYQWNCTCKIHAPGDWTINRWLRDHDLDIISGVWF